MTDNPLFENPTTANLIAGNPTQLIKEVDIKEKINTEDIKYQSINQDAMDTIRKI